MRNVTISLDEETALWARVEAARRDTSVSRFVGDLLRSERERRSRYEQARASYGARRAAPLRAPDQRYPARDEVHQR